MLLVLLALAIGAGAAWFLRTPPPGNQAEIDRLTAQVAELSSKVAAPASDPALKTLQSSLDTSIGGLSDKLAAVDQRMSQMEKRPPPGTPKEITDALTSLTNDLKATQAENTKLTTERDDLRGQVGKLKASQMAMQAQLDTAQKQLAALQDQRKVTEAERKAAAMTRLQAAVTAGQPYAEAASEFETRTGTTLPPALAEHAATGIRTEAMLSASFPDAARAGLAASREAATGVGLTGRTLDFLKSQVGLRSVTPRAGDSPDAVLSRAQAAVDKGDFPAALSDIAKLPDAGQTAMSGWVEAARAHVDALTALGTLVGG